jgi:hypothetical protein
MIRRTDLPEGVKPSRVKTARRANALKKHRKKKQKERGYE